MGPTGHTRVVQIHPTRRCNLRCLHCYSSSSPDERDKLEVTLLFNAVTDAAAEGYNWVSVSGGEPLMYPPLYELLRHTRACGLHTALTTNGMLLDGRRLDKLTGLIDLIAISALCREVYARATQAPKPHFFSWYDLVAQVAAETEIQHTHHAPSSMAAQVI